MRSDQIDEGMNTIAMFTKDEGDPQQTLYDLQVTYIHTLVYLTLAGVFRVG